jgi:hypothetical protein
MKTLIKILFLILTIPLKVIGFISGIIFLSLLVGWETCEDFIDEIEKRHNYGLFKQCRKLRLQHM